MSDTQEPAEAVEAEAGKFDAECEVPRCGFATVGWPTEDAASERLAQHMAEHESGEAMPELYVQLHGTDHEAWAKVDEGSKEG